MKPFTPIIQRQTAFGYSFEDLRLLLTPMARDGVEAVGAMGADTPLSVLSDRPKTALRLLSAAICSGHKSADRLIREEIITSAETTIGSGAKSAQARARKLSPDRTQNADSQQRRISQTQAHQ